MKHRRVAIGFCVLSLAVPAMAVSARYAIGNIQVVAALNSYGVQAKVEDVTVPADVLATTPEPVLNIGSLQHLSDQRVVVRMQCEHPDQCLPFIAILNTSRDASFGASVDAIANALTPQSIAVSRQIVVRNGSPVSLLLDGQHIHIRLQVISLENGAIGQTIRVSDKDQHRVYTAQVVESGVVRGRL